MKNEREKQKIVYIVFHVVLPYYNNAISLPFTEDQLFCFNNLFSKILISTLTGSFNLSDTFESECTSNIELLNLPGQNDILATQFGYTRYFLLV